MSRIEFGAHVAELQAESIELAKASVPDFTRARSQLNAAEELVASDGDILRAAIFIGHTANDLGVVDIREGLYQRSHLGSDDDKVLTRISQGIEEIKVSYATLDVILYVSRSALRARGWETGVHGHIGATMNTWFRATQTAQLVAGDIGPDQKADQAAVDAQWMLGRGKPDEPGAWAHGRQGDNGYWSTQTAFLGVRGERINGGFVHLAKGLKWGMVRGLPELGRTVMTDPHNRRQAVLAAGRLSLESITRKRAIEAALDYRRF